MAITRYNPLNDFIPSTFGSLVENMLNDQVSTEKVFMPAVDIMKEEGKLTLFVSAPGIPRRMFSNNGWLHLRAVWRLWPPHQGNRHSSLR